MNIKQYYRAYTDNRISSSLDFNFCPRCRTKLTKQVLDDHPRNVCPSCQYIQYVNPLPGVSVLVEKNGCLLIGKRSVTSFNGDTWCLPCGFIEHHESFLEAAKREVYEETGLHIKVTGIVNVTSNHLHPDVHSLVVVLTGEVIGGRLKPGDDLTEVAWIGPQSRLPAMAFEADVRVIKAYFAKRLIKIPTDEAQSDIS